MCIRLLNHAVLLINQSEHVRAGDLVDMFIWDHAPSYRWWWIDQSINQSINRTNRSNRFGKSFCVSHRVHRITMSVMCMIISVDWCWMRSTVHPTSIDANNHLQLHYFTCHSINHLHSQIMSANQHENNPSAFDCNTNVSLPTVPHYRSHRHKKIDQSIKLVPCFEHASDCQIMQCCW